MNFKNVRLGKHKQVKTMQKLAIPKIPVYRIREPKNLPPFTLSQWTGGKAEAVLGFQKRFGVWPEKVLHWVDELGSDHWAMMLPKKEAV